MANIILPNRENTFKYVPIENEIIYLLPSDKRLIFL